jgi:hypothetical protein
MPGMSKKTSRRTSARAPASGPSRPGRLDDALGAVSRSMRRLGARWYLFGAQAVALHGVPRATQDIDVTALAEEPILVLAALRAEGISPLIDDPGFLATTRVIPAHHRGSGWKLDLVLGGPGLDELIATEAVKRRVGRVTVPVVRLEHLLVLKVLAGRERDLGDVARLLALHGARVGKAEVRDLLRELEEGLGEDGLVRRFDQLAPPSRHRPPAPRGRGR